MIYWKKIWIHYSLLIFFFYCRFWISYLVHPVYVTIIKQLLRLCNKLKVKITQKKSTILSYIIYRLNVRLIYLLTEDANLVKLESTKCIVKFSGFGQNYPVCFKIKSIRYKMDWDSWHSPVIKLLGGQV